MSTPPLHTRIHGDLFATTSSYILQPPSLVPVRIKIEIWVVGGAMCLFDILLWLWESTPTCFPGPSHSAVLWPLTQACFIISKPRFLRSFPTKRCTVVSATSSCYTLNHDPFLKFMHWSPNPWCDDIWRWGPQKVTKFSEVRREGPLASGHRAGSQEESAHLESNCCHLDLGLPSLQTVRNQFLSFKPPSLRYFIMATWGD